jgi:hypothetical protein
MNKIHLIAIATFITVFSILVTSFFWLTNLVFLSTGLSLVGASLTTYYTDILLHATFKS